MFELLRLIPRSVIPAMVSLGAWFVFNYAYVTEVMYERHVERRFLPKLVASAQANAKYHGRSINAKTVEEYGRCVYWTVYKSKDFKRDFAFYVASFGWVSGDAVGQLFDRFKKVSEQNLCGEEPWRKTK